MPDLTKVKRNAEGRWLATAADSTRLINMTCDMLRYGIAVVRVGMKDQGNTPTAPEHKSVLRGLGLV